MSLDGGQEASTPHLARTEVRLYFHVVAICCPRNWASGVPGNFGKHSFGQCPRVRGEGAATVATGHGERSTSSQKVHKRTVAARASMGSCGTNDPGRRNFLLVAWRRSSSRVTDWQPESLRDFLLDFANSVSSHASGELVQDFVEDHHAFLHDRWKLTGDFPLEVL
jgi:hypothetical protein